MAAALRSDCDAASAWAPTDAERAHLMSRPKAQLTVQYMATRRRLRHDRLDDRYAERQRLCIGISAGRL
jgi:hypothetical protein